uniref:F-box only protein 30 isoform X1 n=2 Tax=Myxine glutinosa TaxID=7769 RepID=UPI00358E6F07
MLPLDGVPSAAAEHVHCARCVTRRCKARLGTGGICEVRPCPAACGALFHACKGNEHRQLCPLERVPCPNAGYGCPLWMHRCAIGAHIRVCPASVVCCTMEWNRWPVRVGEQQPQQFQDTVREEEHDATEQLDMALALRDQRILLESLRVATLVSKSRCKKACIGEVSTTVGHNQETMDSQPHDSTPPLPLPHFDSSALPESRQSQSSEQSGNCTDSFHKECERDPVMAHTSSREMVVVDLQQEKAVDVLNNDECSNYLPRERIECNRKIKETKLENCDIVGREGPSERGQDVLHDSFHRITVNEAFLGAEDLKGCHEDIDSNDCDSHKEKVLDVGLPMVMDTALDTMHQAWMNEESSRTSKLSDLGITGQREQQKSTNSPMNECNKHLLPRFPLPDSFRRSVIGDLCWSLHKVEEKAVDTIELEEKHSQNGDPHLDMSGIDLVTAALLFCLDSSSPRGRSISDRHVSVDGLHVDVGTQTFSAPSAMLATRTVVGEMASASACDHANPQLSNPSPFPRLGLNLVLECVERYRARQRSMFTFVCGQVFRRDEYPHHFKNVHGDIHAGLNGWLEQRCPLAQYGCSYTQLRFCPGSMPGSRVVYSTLLRSFGVQPFVAAELEKSAVHTCIGVQVSKRLREANESPGKVLRLEGDKKHKEPHCLKLEHRNCVLASSECQRTPASAYLDLMSCLPFVVLRNVARFLDGYSLCQLSRVSRLMREVCGSLLAERGMVELVWKRHAQEAGKISWQVSHKVWHFSTSFSPVSLWKFAEVPSMADHLRRCRYNMVERRIEAVPMPCMCGPRQRRKKGRALRSLTLHHSNPCVVSQPSSRLRRHFVTARGACYPPLSPPPPSLS